MLFEMKTTVIPTLLISLVLFSCHQAARDQHAQAIDSSTQAEAPVVENQAPPAAQENKFDIDRIPVAGKDLGVFPFFSLPEGLKPLNKPIQRKYDQLFFPIDNVMVPEEGMVWKTYVTPQSGKGDDWSEPFFEKSYDDAIKAAGGVKIFDGKVSKQELDRIKDQASYFGEEGSIDYWNDPVKVYVIHRPDSGDVYIQLSGNTAGGEIQILETKPFKQTITILKADQIQHDLEQKGKVVLHIQFDTDQATLRPDGRQAVEEILKALQSDSRLKVAINGYTDNTGAEPHNLQLSKDRAATVMNTLISAGIDKSRLTAQGFGDKNPLADNGTDAGKAENRRVELVKM